MEQAFEDDEYDTVEELKAKISELEKMPQGGSNNDGIYYVKKDNKQIQRREAIKHNAETKIIDFKNHQSIFWLLSISLVV